MNVKIGLAMATVGIIYGIVIVYVMFVRYRFHAKSQTSRKGRDNATTSENTQAKPL